LYRIRTSAGNLRALRLALPTPSGPRGSTDYYASNPVIGATASLAREHVGREHALIGAQVVAQQAFEHGTSRPLPIVEVRPAASLH
jgi:hypothetical protein